MLFGDRLVVLRGGGDLGTGVALRLSRAGFPVVVCELAHPLTVRRTVALSSAVHEGEVSIEGLVGRRAEPWEAGPLARTGVVPVVVAAGLPPLEATVVVDARMAKRNIDTTIDDAPLVVALGPGFTAGVDCHAVVETMRGAHLGRVLWEGSAQPDTGVPGELGGRTGDRVLRAPVAGVARWRRAIGDTVTIGEVLGDVGGTPVAAPFAGVVRGLVADGTPVPAGLKVGDVDPRLGVRVDEVSDKSLAIGGGVVEAVLSWLARAG